MRTFITDKVVKDIFPQLRERKMTGDVYLFPTKTMVGYRLTFIDTAPHHSCLYEDTNPFTGSVTLSNE